MKQKTVWTLFCLFWIAAAVPACSTFSNNRVPDGMIRSGWRTAPSHYWKAPIPAKVLASASFKLDTFLKAETNDSTSKAILIPRPYGYDVDLYTKQQLPAVSKQRVRAFVNTAIVAARREE
ncbi:hypothetical protein ACXR0O_25090 [Verrucomicrobiota bacterium sgz303538]